MLCSNAYPRLQITIVPPATKYRPLDQRKYLLTYIEKNDEYHLFIFKNKHNAVENKKPITLSGEWRYKMGQYILIISINMTNFPEVKSNFHDLISPYLNKLEQHLSAMINGDSSIYKYFPWLVDTGIYLQINLNHAQYTETIYLGRPRKYLQKEKPKIMTY